MHSVIDLATAERGTYSRERVKGNCLEADEVGTAGHRGRDCRRPGVVVGDHQASRP